MSKTTLANKAKKLKAQEAAGEKPAEASHSSKFCQDCKSHSNSPSYCKLKKCFCARKGTCESWKEAK